MTVIIELGHEVEGAAIGAGFLFLVFRVLYCIGFHPQKSSPI